MTLIFCQQFYEAISFSFRGKYNLLYNLFEIIFENIYLKI